MSILVGPGPKERGRSAAVLGGMLARSLETSLHVAAITPVPWPPDPFQGDREFLALQDGAAHAELDRVAGDLAGLDVTYTVEAAPSVAAGLLAVLERTGPAAVVLGSSTAGHAHRVSLGSVAERILRETDVPVCFAPDGFAVPAGATFTRLTVGFGRADHDSRLLAGAVRLARALRVSLRVVCLAVRPADVLGESVERSADSLVLDKWTQRLRGPIEEAVRSAGDDPAAVDIVVGVGTGWDEAVAQVPWTVTDLLAVGSTLSAARRYLLGSHAAKIVRRSPVPVLTIARRG